MAMTDEERQQIVDEVLAQLRADSKDFSTNQISISTDFENASEERASIKIPAFDERTNTGANADPGTISLEALLTAYGLPKVQQIASDISTKYMKKTADSDLDMQGHSLLNTSMIQSNLRGQEARSIYFILPVYTYSNVGSDTSETDYIRKVLIKLCQDYPNVTAGTFKGTARPNTYTTFEASILTTSYIDGNGLPYCVTGYMMSYQSKMMYFFHRGDSGDLVIERVSTFPYGNTTKDNRIREYGENSTTGQKYIIYENGRQECWGQIAVTGKIDILWTSGTYYADLSGITQFAQPFGILESCVISHVNSDAGFYYLYSQCNNSGILRMQITCPFQDSNTRTFRFFYHAIGKAV